MAEYLTNDAELTKIADAIRTKGGTTRKLTYPDGFVEAVANLPSGSGIPGFSVLSEFELPWAWSGTVNFACEGRTRRNTMVLLWPSRSVNLGHADGFLVKDAVGTSKSLSSTGNLTITLDEIAESVGSLVGTITFNEGAVETWDTYYSKGYLIGTN